MAVQLRIISPSPLFYRLVLDLHVGQLLFIDTHLLSQGQALGCHGIHFLHRKGRDQVREGKDCS